MSALNRIPQPLGKLQGKLAVITGGTTGIGLAAAKLFVTEGAYVFITGRRQQELDVAVKAIGGNVTGVQGDVAKMADLDRLYETVRAHGRIDIVVANARVAEFARLENITEEHFDKLFNNVQPGPIDTELNPATAEWAVPQKAVTALNRYGHVDDIAAMVAFVAGPEASYVTGANLTVDGGMNA